MDDPIPERRLEPETLERKIIGIGFHTFTINDITISSRPQRIQDFYIWMATNNMSEQERYMILSQFTSRFSKILKDQWNSLGVNDKNTYLTSQDFAFNIKIL